MASQYFIGPQGTGSGLPDQTGNSGKFLTTNGSATSWGDAPTATYATQAEMEAASSTSVAVSPGRAKYAPSAAKVWCVFDGTAGTIAVAASLNVTSLTDNGTGNYTINFTTSFSSGAYAAVASCNEPGGAGYMADIVGVAGSFGSGAVQVRTFRHDNTAGDVNNVSLVAFGDQ